MDHLEEPFLGWNTEYPPAGFAKHWTQQRASSIMGCDAEQHPEWRLADPKVPGARPRILCKHINTGDTCVSECLAA